MTYLPIALCGLLGLSVVLLFIPLILKAFANSKLFRRAEDMHHTHKTSIPRLGGLALAVAFIGIEIFLAIFCPQQRAETPGRGAVLLGSLAIFGLGFWDDLRPIGARRKLLGQILIASCICWSGISIETFKIPFTDTIIQLHGWGVVFTVLWLVGMTNLINLIDGVDGLAGGICLMLMTLLAYVGHQTGGFLLLATGMAGALLGFLRFNFPPARIYLGDGGAYFLGFLIGLLAILNSHKGTIIAALVAPLFVLALPILDTMLAISRRGLRGLPIFRPDRRHIHHHLLGMGLSRRKVVLSLYGVTLVFLVMGFAAFWSRGNLVPVLLGVSALLLLLVAGKLNFSREWFAVGRIVGNSLGMREEIHYALTLTRWLALEGGRCASVESLWGDLVFVAQKLGFCSVKLTLADGERSWAAPVQCPAARSIMQELTGGRCGLLELRAPAHSLEENCPEPTCPLQDNCQLPACRASADIAEFEIISELLGEGWVSAVNKLNHGTAPIRFDMQPAASPLPKGKTRTKFSGVSPADKERKRAARPLADTTAA